VRTFLQEQKTPEGADFGGGHAARSAGVGRRGSGYAAVGAGGYVDSSPTRSVGQSFDPAARGVSRGSLLSCLTTGFSAQWPFHMTRKPRSAFSVDAKPMRSLSVVGVWVFEFLTNHRQTVNYQLVNRLISVNYSFRHVGTIRLTLAPHPLETLSHLHGISTPLAPEDSV
jgi:hypothetical protein